MLPPPLTDPCGCCPPTYMPTYYLPTCPLARLPGLPGLPTSTHPPHALPSSHVGGGAAVHRTQYP